jgi:NADH-quinone oxidoreductase subunit M
MVILGAVKFNFWIGLLAATALIFGAAYSLWMAKRVIFGAVTNHHVAELVDMNGREFFMLGLLAILPWPWVSIPASSPTACRPR